MHAPTMLVILDGFGWSTNTAHNAIATAHTPHLDYLLAHYPHTLLKASGTAVGLPHDTIGNSEVGHETIGAGRIIPQAFARIHTAVENGSLKKNPVIQQQFLALARSGHALHFAGLLSDAGVHSHIEHLFALLTCAKEYEIKKVYIHGFLDGRDVAPETASYYLTELQAYCDQLKIGTLASIIGRFYPMDRDHNWDRTEIAYDLMTESQHSDYHTWQQALNAYYHNNITDEFIPPTQLDAQGILKDGDGLLFFNFRPDRARQLHACFAYPQSVPFPTRNLHLAFCSTMTSYDRQMPKQSVLFPKEPIPHTLKEVLSTHNKTVFSIAETEKYAHITYFFGGGSEHAFPHETQILIPSIPAKNYIELACMSAPEITKTVIDSLTTSPQDFYLINYANADMVGHSGDFQATVKAIECLDEQLGILYDTVVTKLNGTLYITGDHGKAENMYDEKAQQPKTAHTNNPVPFIMAQQKLKGQVHTLALTQLKDIAPFILKNLGLPIPLEME
ncbi:MAG: 2,3-bisphosphoglycerate-independent phosphoglycerate mutase [Candidatus Babeliales bacterium]